MVVLLLAAGRSKRMSPIEDKNQLTFLGDNLLSIQISKLKNAGFSDIIVVCNKHNKEFVGTITSSFVEQEDLELGIKGAILSSEKYIKDKDIIIVNSNDIVEDLVYKNLLALINKGNDGVIVSKKVDNYFPGGYIKVKKTNIIESIIEKPGEGNEPSDIINILIHYHKDSNRLLKYLRNITSNNDDQYELALDSLFKEKNYISLEYSDTWKTIKYPWHILDVTNYFLSKLEPHISKTAEISKHSSIIGNVIIEDNVKIMDHSSIVGPCYIGANTVIANNSLVRNSIINKNSVIGYSTEIARSYIGDNVWTHHNYLGDSIVCDNVTFGAGTITGNLRLDNKSIYVKIKDRKIDTKLKKLGAIIGQNTKFGVNTSIMPGKKIGMNCVIGPNINLHKDIKNDSHVFQKCDLNICNICE